MRHAFSRLIVTAALTALAAPALAQTQGDIKTPPAAPQSFTGVIDFGARTTSLTGDGARYERYRDLGDGLFLDTLRTRYNNNGWYLTGAIDHMARKDARYDFSASLPGKFKVWGRYDKIPMLMSRTTSTLYQTTAPGVFRIDDSIQAALQAAPAAKQVALMTGFLASNSTVFSTESHRNIGNGGVEYAIDPSTTLRMTYQRTDRDGVIPFGGTYGFSNAIELPAPIDHKMTEFTGFLERVEGPWLFQGNFDQLNFTNQTASMIWDNPYRLTDSATVPSQGRMPLAPSNTSYNVSGSASLKLPRKTRATVYVNAGVLDADATILPNTINTALAVVPLARATTGAHADTLATNVTLTSRPLKNVGINARYRYFDYKNQTPTYAQTGQVNYDTAVVALSSPNVSSRYGGVRESFDGDVTWRVAGSTLGAGYTWRKSEFEDRIFQASSENTMRLLYDAFSSRWFSVHSKYEHSIRKGTGLDTSEIAADGEQPGMRTFDIADRNRDLFTLTGTVTPVSSVGFSLSAGAGQDKYPNSQFGLFNAKHQIYSAGFDATPRDWVSFGASFDIETYRSLQWSRQANPGVQFTDPTRDWSTSGRDSVQSFLANVDLMKIARNLDVRSTYDYNHGSTLYLYGTGSVVDRTLPEGSTVMASTLPPPVSLPEVMSQLNRGTVDATYALSTRFSVGLTYWYERYKVDDFALDAEAIPQNNLPSALLLGYQYLPYTAHTVFGRLIVRW
jgi:MtrB/PioB family decaheme-associated outer membrane protein